MNQHEYTIDAIELDNGDLVFGTADVYYRLGPAAPSVGYAGDLEIEIRSITAEIHDENGDATHVRLIPGAPLFAEICRKIERYVEQEICDA